MSPTTLPIIPRAECEEGIISLRVFSYAEPVDLDSTCGLLSSGICVWTLACGGVSSCARRCCFALRNPAFGLAPALEGAQGNRSQTMTNSIRCLCLAVLATFFTPACASAPHANVPAAADAAHQFDVAYVIPDTIEFPQPTGSFTIVRGQRRTLIDPSRDLEGNVLHADAGALDGGDAGAGLTRPLSVEIWYPSDSPGSGATVPYLDSAEAPSFLLPEFANHVRTHSYSNLPFASSLTQAPALLFSPAYNAQPRMYTAFIEEAVSRGYIVVAISHTLWTPVTTFADGSTINMTHSVNDSNISSAAGVWLADAGFVLDEPSRPHPRIPTARSRVMWT